MGFRLTPISMTLDDLELHKFEFLVNFSGFRGISDAIAVKRMKIGQNYQRQRCRHVELEQFWQAFASRGFVSDSWAFLFVYFYHDFFHVLTFFTRATSRYASAGNRDRNVSVCLSVCLSVTRRYCVKTKKAIAS